MFKLKRVLLTVGIFLLLNITVAAQSQTEVNPQFNPSSEEAAYINLNYDCSNLIWPDWAVDVYRKVSFNGGNPSATTYYRSKDVSILQLAASDNPTSLDGVSEAPDPFLDEETGMIMCPVIKSFNSNGEPVLDRDKLVPANLIPPTLQQAENYFIKFLYIVFVAAGFIATIAFFRLGIEMMLSGWSPEQIGDLFEKFKWNVFLIVIFILTIPGIYSVYNFLNLNTTECFKYEGENNGDPNNNGIVYDLTLPGFTFFFSDVCTGEYAVDN